MSNLKKYRSKFSNTFIAVNKLDQRNFYQKKFGTILLKFGKSC